jgi:hypothetical protein
VENQTVDREPLAEDLAVGQSWLSGVGGIVLFLVLIGLIFVWPLWWVWTKSPLRFWVQIAVSLAAILLLIIIL